MARPQFDRRKADFVKHVPHVADMPDRSEWAMNGPCPGRRVKCSGRSGPPLGAASRARRNRKKHGNGRASRGWPRVSTRVGITVDQNARHRYDPPAASAGRG